MMDTPANDDPRSFWRADLDEAGRELVKIVREVRPLVMVTYDANGFYGHPDHIQAHRVAWRAFEKAADPSYGEGEPWQVAKFYATAVPLSVLERAIQIPDGPFAGVERVEDLGFGVPDDQVTTVIDASVHLDAKIAAMRAHRTQIAVDGPFFALADNVGQQAYGVEYYTLLAGELPTPIANGRETDLFAGLG